MSGDLTAIHSVVQSFELERLIAPGFIERRAPYLVRGLMLGAAKPERGPETEVEIARVLKRVDQLFRIELGPSLLDRLDQHVSGDIALKRNVIGRFAGEIFGKRALVFQHRR